MNGVPFAIAVAFVAAAIGDLGLESFSSGGIFGARYIDTDHQGVLPAILMGTAIVAVALAIRAFDGWRRAFGHVPARATAPASFALERVPFARPFAIFAMQIAAVYAIETLEAALASSPVAPGLAWLGAPVAFALCAHALVGIVVFTAMRAIVRFLATGIDAAIGYALAIATMRGRRALGAPSFDRRRLPAFVRVQDPHARQLGGRAPPRALLVNHR